MGFYIAQTPDDGFLIGSILEKRSPPGVHLIKTDSRGKNEWEKTIDYGEG